MSVYNHDCLRIDWPILKSVIHAKNCSPYEDIKTHLIGDLGNPGLLLVLYWLACCGGKHSSMSHLRWKEQHSKQQRHHEGLLSEIFKKKGEWRRKRVWNMAKGNKENQLTEVISNHWIVMSDMLNTSRILRNKRKNVSLRKYYKVWMCMPNYQHTGLIQFNSRNWQSEFADLGDALTGMTLLSYF